MKLIQRTHTSIRRACGRAMLTVAAVGMAHAADYYVDVEWTGAQSGTTTAPYTTIKAAVDAANAVAATHNIYIAAGWYGDVANGGSEDYSAGGGTGGGGGGISVQRKINFYGGYAGWDGDGTDAADFDWTAGSRAPRATVIDLSQAASRAFTADTATHGSFGPFFDGMSFINAQHGASGGAIHQASAYYEGMGVNNCLFQSNSVTGSGGAVYNNMDCPGYIVANSEFLDNTATVDGGALWQNMNNGTIYVTNCVFRGNRATGAGSQGGAAFFNPPGPIDVRNCVFENNQSGGRGGAVFSPMGNLYLRLCDFHGNSAPQGAAMGGNTYHVGQYNLENCLIYNNSGGYAVQAEGYNGVTYMIDMLHCTVVSNAGGGVRASYQTASASKSSRIRNSIIGMNGGYGVYQAQADDPIILQRNNVYSNAINNYFGVSADAGSISTDPVFIDAAAANYRLAITSPSIDAGTNNTLLVKDYVGTMRPTRNGWDQGCYEEIDACRIQNLAPVTTSTNAVLRGQLDYDGAMPADVHIYWGIDDGGTDQSAWANTNIIGLLASPAIFTFTNALTPGQSYWFRCFVSNAYDAVWADASWAFTAEDVHVWTGLAGGGLASTPGNWFNSFLPTAGGTVKLDSYQANMTWDAAAPQQVLKWVQTDQYNGTVTIATGWSNSFDTLMITTDMTINGGTLTHLANPSSGAALYRLKVDVGGNLTLAAGKQINADGKGYTQGKGPGAGTANNQGGTHGGEGYRAPAAAVCYGSVWEPETLGSGGGGAVGRAGGGAVYLTVAGTATVNGTVSADGQVSTGNNGYGGAGGSVFLRAAQMAGTGTIRSNGSGTGHDASGGGGGRVAVIVTNDTSFAGLTLTAFGLAAHGERNSAAGTVYKESTAHDSQQGIVVIDNNNIFTRRARTVIPAAHAIEQFAEIVLSRASVLGIDTGDTFDFGSMANLTLNGPTASYITVRDLTGITFPSAFTLAGYTLRLDTPLAQTADWTIAANGSLAHSAFDGSVDVGLDLTLTGNLTVNGTIDVRRGGYPRGDDGSAYRGPGYTEGQGGSHGGRGFGAGVGRCYGSILSPAHLGSASYYGTGGGRARLVVSGDTAVSGSILAGCFPMDTVNASGGSLDLQTGTLSGSGTISSTGGRTTGMTHSEKGGGGGRMRIKLTGSDSFGNVTLTAAGGRGGAGDVNGTAGACSIYLEPASESAGQGRIIIDNINTTPIRATDFPPTQLFADNLSAATLVITNGAWLNLTTNVAIGNLYMSANATFTLNGYTCKVNSLQHPIAGTPTGPGEVRWRMGTVLLIR